MAECGATSHGTTDGSRAINVAQKCGDAEVCPQDLNGRCVTVTLKGALCMPYHTYHTYPQDIFSVRAATNDGAKVVFKKGTKLTHNQ